MRDRAGGNIKRIIAAGLSAALALSFQATAMAAEGEKGKSPDDTVRINPAIRYQTLEGWGTSLAWFANIVGGWTEDYNGNGRADREDIAELIFSPEYLNMNVVRYNIGGGDDPTHTHMKRAEGKIPGWKSSADAKLDPEADANQIWFLEKANEYHREDVINEVFSNSPPWYMTNSGCSTGNTDPNENNLKDGCYDDFAEYLAEVTEYLDQSLRENYGTGIHYIDPVNEPDTGYWGAGSPKQEGCHFSPGESQTRVFEELDMALAARGLSGVKLTGTDETSIEAAVNSFKQLSPQIRNRMDTISAHTYGSWGREVLSDLAASYDKGLWMSEFCPGGGPHDIDSMEYTGSAGFSDSVMEDLKILQSTVWVGWQAVDSEYECLNWNNNWGFIHAVYEEDGPVAGYHGGLLDDNGDAKEWVPGHGTWHLTKQFYTMMQYSKFLKRGYTMIEAGDADTAAAISPDRSELVIVCSNNGGETRQQWLDLSLFEGIAKVEAYRTSDELDCEPIEANISGELLAAELPARSVTTYVIKGRGSLLTDPEVIRRVNSGVETNEDTRAAGVSEWNKFSYDGSWNKYGWQDEAYKHDVMGTTEPGASCTFTFEGSRAVLTGNTEPIGGKLVYTVDGGEPVEVDTWSETKLYNQVMADTGELEKGRHVITVAMEPGSTGDVETPMITIDEARVYGTDQYLAALDKAREAMKKAQGAQADAEEARVRAKAARNEAVRLAAEAEKASKDAETARKKAEDMTAASVEEKEAARAKALEAGKRAQEAKIQAESAGKAARQAEAARMAAEQELEKAMEEMEALKAKTGEAREELDEAVKEAEKFREEAVRFKEEAEAALCEAEEILRNLAASYHVNKPEQNDSKPKAPTPKRKAGDTWSDGKLNYKVKDRRSRTVTVTGAVKSGAMSIVIPSAVKIRGKRHKVTAVEKNAFKGSRKLRKVFVGKNVKSIGNRAFYKCVNLKAITIKSYGLVSVGKGAFKGISRKAVIEVSKKKKTVYGKKLRSSGLAKTAIVK